MKDELKQLLEEKVAQKWDAFKTAHPTAASILEERYGDPVALVCTSVQQDEAYKKLEADTAVELDIGRVGTIIGNALVVVFDKFIAGAL